MTVLMDFLSRNASNKRVMATLRCGLVETTEMRAWPLLAHLGGIGNKQQSIAVRTVAGLFALHSLNCESGNMGTVCRLLCGTEEKPWDNRSVQNDGPGAMERRFLYLINADREEICARVCRLVRYAHSQEIPVNYAALEKDLATWPRAREAWASAFWAPVKNDEKPVPEGESL